MVVSLPLVFDNRDAATELRGQLIPHVPKPFRLCDLSYNSCALEASFELREGFVRVSFLSHLHVVKLISGLFRLVASEVVRTQ